MLKRLWSAVTGKQQQQRAALTESENYFTLGTRSWGSDERDRYDYDREDMLAQALEAWRVNPIARRIVELTTQYVVGAGLRISSDHKETHAFIEAWWGHRLNQLAVRVYEWCDEMTRSGEIFLIISTDASGMSYMRAVPAADIDTIETAENDIQQELAYVQKAHAAGETPVTWQAYDPDNDNRQGDGSFPAVMVHYAINRPVGAVRGESDLAPLLRWLSRYTSWLEDRARLNRYRNAFMFIVKGAWADEAQRYARQTALATTPPPPGSFLVVDETETWEVLNPQLESQDAGEDGLALKKMIAAGAGLPLHFLAEPESSTKSTAESAGGPTYRHFEQRQEFFCWLVEDLARLAIRRRKMVHSRVRDKAPLKITGADLSARDNAALAVAMTSGYSALAELRDRCIIDDAELLRMVYRFAGEVTDVEQLIAQGRAAGKRLTSNPDGVLPGGAPKNTDDKDGPPSAGGVKPVAISKVVDRDSGETKGAADI